MELCTCGGLLLKVSRQTLADLQANTESNDTGPWINRWDRLGWDRADWSEVRLGGKHWERYKWMCCETEKDVQGN